MRIFLEQGPLIYMNDLVKICGLFKDKGIQFVIAGARASALHGHIRATEDIDVLIRKDLDNIQKVILCIRELYPHLEEFTAEDLISNIVIKILDEPELDIMLSAWSVTYEDAQEDICKLTVEGVEIPYLGLKTLIKSKQTEREQDKWDIQILNEILRKKGSRQSI